jgi:hypothetical protein
LRCIGAHQRVISILSSVISESSFATQQ